MTDNVAVLQGYTQEVLGECTQCTIPLLIRPGTDLDSTFKAWDMDSQEFLFIHGWLWEFHPHETPSEVA